MRESLRIDSPFMGAGMPKAYSRDLRERVITAVETGASRREAAERFEVSVASAVKWLQRWYQQRSAAPKPRGGSVSPLEEFAVEILDLIAQRPDLILVETVAELRKRRIKTSRSSLWRFLDRHNITLKKSAASSRTADIVQLDRRAVGYALLTALTICAYSVTDGIGVRLSQNPLGYVQWLFVANAIVLVPYALWRDRSSVTVAMRRFWLRGLAGARCRPCPTALCSGQ